MADAVGDRTGARDHHHARAGAGAGDQRDQRVVDDQRVRAEAEAPHDVANDAAVVLSRSTPAMPRHTAAGVTCAAVRGLLDHRVEHLLDLELALGLQVGAAGAAFADDAAVGVGEEGDGLRAAGVDAEDMHRS